MRVEREIPEYVFDNLDNLKSEALAQGYTLKQLDKRARNPKCFSFGMRARLLFVLF